MALDRQKKKEHLYSDNNELEEVSAVLRSSSISDEVFEPLQAEETSSKVTKKKKEEKTKEIKKAIVKWLFTFSFLFFFFKTLGLNFHYK